MLLDCAYLLVDRARHLRVDGGDDRVVLHRRGDDLPCPMDGVFRHTRSHTRQNSVLTPFPISSKAIGQRIPSRGSPVCHKVARDEPFSLLPRSTSMRRNGSVCYAIRNLAVLRVSRMSRSTSAALRSNAMQVRHGCVMERVHDAIRQDREERSVYFTNERTPTRVCSTAVGAGTCPSRALGSPGP